MIKLELNYPNSANTHWKLGRGRLYLSKAGNEYREHVKAQVEAAGHEAMTGRLFVTVWLTPGTRHKHDIDNRIKPLLDALEAAKVLVNDEQIDMLLVGRGLVVPRHGMCQVTVQELDTKFLTSAKNRSKFAASLINAKER
jgi:Holliday junction resolvase RusA-like endonuclease